MKNIEKELNMFAILLGVNKKTFKMNEILVGQKKIQDQLVKLMFTSLVVEGKQLFKIDKIDTLFRKVCSIDEGKNYLVDSKVQPPSNRICCLVECMLKIPKNIERDLNLLTMFCGTNKKRLKWINRLNGSSQKS